MEPWTVDKSRELYNINSWGEGYFDINAQGNVVVRPERVGGKEVDLRTLVNSLVARGIDAPVLLRFDGIIQDRVNRLYGAFEQAISEAGYTGQYRGVFPIKVNQQRHVVDSFRKAGQLKKLGLEVGSKPELIAVLAIHDNPGALLLCNGYKDREYIELALLASRLGRRVIIIIEQMHEMDLVLEIAASLGVEAEVGLRMKPTTKGSGHWESSGGEAAKFGLTTSEIVSVIDGLISAKRGHWLKLLHHHVGSQITAISAIKRVLRESTRMYTEIARLCPSLCFFDVGGGLAVDYDGSNTHFHSSMNYTVDEYARDVVDAIADACREAGIPHPDIITESGRALSAHHAVLLVQVVDTAPVEPLVPHLGEPPTDDEAIKQFYSLYESLTVKNCHETLNDAVALRDEVFERFIQGDLNLVERAYVEKSFWQLMVKIHSVAQGLRHMPEDIEKLSEKLRDTYFCSFSVFQSVPDFWAIEQLFPIMPIQRLSEEPSRRGIVVDMSCDSDGKIDKFIDLKDVKNHVPLHMVNGSPYYLGIFLVGAYQETLGDLHNLFGDTNAVHVELDENGECHLSHVVEGDTVKEVLSYVQYDAADLAERLRQGIERALKEGRLTEEESAKLQKRYKEAMEGYTYFQVQM